MNVLIKFYVLLLCLMFVNVSLAKVLEIQLFKFFTIQKRRIHNLIIFSYAMIASIVNVQAKIIPI